MSLPILKLTAIDRRFAETERSIGPIWKSVRSFAAAITALGGQAYLVGGAVRDLLLERLPKDLDIEVHRLSPETVRDAAATLGPVSSVGQSFGVLKVHLAGHDIDISLPRRETKTGAGHRDFSIGIDPMMGVPAAARRRDFTIGAIYLDLHTGEVHDPYGGMNDLERRQLRSVDAHSFIEDPLRLLRGLQLAARFGLSVEPATRTAMQEIVPAMGSISADRVRDEWIKMLLADEPARGLTLGRLSGYIEQWQPELSALWATPQDPATHPEGSAWEHTLLAIEHAVKISLASALPEEERLVVVTAALVHDLGKPSTSRTVEGELRADGHEQAGIEPAKAFLRRVGFGPHLQNRILSLIQLHHRPDQIFRLAAQGHGVRSGELRRLVREVRPATLSELLIVTAADQLGRGPFARPDGLVTMPEHWEGYAWWQKIIAAEKLNDPVEPILSGHDLIQRGWAAGPQIGQAVNLADQLGLHGMERSEVLEILDTVATPTEAVATLQSLVQAEIK